jgi:hypothetical protein
MTITIYLPPDLEKRLRDKANAAGVAAEDIVLDAVAERLGLKPAYSLSGVFGNS